MNWINSFYKKKHRQARNIWPSAQLQERRIKTALRFHLALLRVATVK